MGQVDRLALTLLCVIVVAAFVVAIAPADAGELTLEAGAGMTLFPIRGADVGPFVSIGLGELPGDIPIIGGETGFIDFGQLDGVATLGPSISIRSVTSKPLRIGWAAWRGGHVTDTIYLRYAVPFGVTW